MKTDWNDISSRCLQAAELLLRAGYPAQAVEMAWLSMSCAVRRLLSSMGWEAASEADLTRLYSRIVLPKLRVSPENRRAFTIVSQLRERVFSAGLEEGDPLTARACLDDARSFLRELKDVDLPGEKTTSGDGMSAGGDGRAASGPALSPERDGSVNVTGLAKRLPHPGKGDEG